MRNPHVFLIFFTIALAMTIPPLAIHAASVTSDTAPSAPAQSNYSSMTNQDCVTLPSRQSSYGANEFRDRSNYCNNMRTHSTSTTDPDTHSGITGGMTGVSGHPAVTNTEGAGGTGHNGLNTGSTGTNPANGVNNSPTGGNSSLGTALPGAVGAGAGANTR